MREKTVRQPEDIRSLLLLPGGEGWDEAELKLPSFPVIIRPPKLIFNGDRPWQGPSMRFGAWNFSGAWMLAFGAFQSFMKFVHSRNSCYPAHILNNSASSITFTPSFCAFSSFE